MVAARASGGIDKGEISCYYGCEVVEIQNSQVILQKKKEGRIFEVPADFVIKTIGFEADMDLFHQLGIELVSEQQCPRYDENTMETDIEGVYVLGTVVAGTQRKYRIFIENTHVHVEKILRAICEKLGIRLNILQGWHPRKFLSTERLEE